MFRQFFLKFRFKRNFSITKINTHMEILTVARTEP